MKEKYNFEIEQLDLNGVLINTFPNRHLASTHTQVHKDSIISCCLGKYQTAGGFIFRFKDHVISPTPKSGNIVCGICSSKETPRSMAMHLKWTHNISTQDYVETYGEFRPKQLKIQETECNFKCEICNKKLMSNQHLMYHLTKEHKDTTQSDYILKYFYQDNPPLCKCGCGGEVSILRNGRNCDLGKDLYNRDYIKGHWDWEVFSGVGKQSKEEIELVNFIKSIYNGEIQESVRGIIPKGEIDIYLPELNIGIEYNGLYWHSEKAGRFKDYHIDKTLKAKNVGIRLIQIFSDEWNGKKDIVKSKLKSILGITNPNKIYARKCDIRVIIDPKLKNQFLDQHHIQGKDRSKVKIGLYYENQIVSIMTFTTPRMVLGGSSNTENTWELCRYATSLNVIGGASKLLNYFIKNYNPSNIFSYSDNRWSDWSNNMYLKIGFTQASISKPGYFYTKDYIQRIHRFNFSKQNLKKRGIDIENKTEGEIMQSLGYTKVWDCGVTKFNLNISSSNPI